MKVTAKTRMLLTAAAVMVAFAGAATTAAPAEAANWNIPWKNIHYPNFPECATYMSPFESGYGTQICKGYYIVNRSNYMFTQDNTHVCPAIGKKQLITLEYVLNPASGGVTTTRALKGFSMHW